VVLVAKHDMLAQQVEAMVSLRAKNSEVSSLTVTNFQLEERCDHLLEMYGGKVEEVQVIFHYCQTFFQYVCFRPYLAQSFAPSQL